jgi:hypothetical protein
MEMRRCRHNYGTEYISHKGGFTRSASGEYHLTVPWYSPQLLAVGVRHVSISDPPNLGARKILICRTMEIVKTNSSARFPPPNSVSI